VIVVRVRGEVALTAEYAFALYMLLTVDRWPARYHSKRAILHAERAKRKSGSRFQRRL
jgi:hypothetical protein